MEEISENRWKSTYKIVNFEGTKRLIDDIFIPGAKNVDDSTINNLRYLENTVYDPSPEGSAALEHWQELFQPSRRTILTLQKI